MDCPICLGDIEQKDKVITNCNHIYHKQCLEKWYKVSHRCPLCRESTFNISLDKRSRNYWAKKAERESEISLSASRLIQY